MKDSATVGTPLQIARIESSRADGGTVALRLSGRWLDRDRAGEEELLVVQVQGRRHRFPATRDPESPDSEGWSASFTLPGWAEPRHDGQAALWLGSSVIPVPPPGEPAAAPEAVPAEAMPADAVAESADRNSPEAENAEAPDTGEGPEPVIAPAPPPPPTPSALRESDPEPPRSGPLADLLLKETVAALHAELEQRTAEAVRLRGSLADSQSELESRRATQAALEATQEALRSQLEKLTMAVERHRKEVEARTAETEQARADSERRASELAAARDERASEAAALREQLAGAQARVDRRVAEAARLREELAGAKVARDAAVSEVTGLRAEVQRLGTELAATRERIVAESGDLGEAQRLLADARALAAQLRDG
ncbi:MAG TPA: hypothetical protein VGH45_10625 [Solirubrobacteraceae bacterium]|jgi:hypothetical protein